MTCYAEAKVYFDGSHYIAIPRTTRPTRKHSKPLEERITVSIDEEIDLSECEDITALEIKEGVNIQNDIENIKNPLKNIENLSKKTKNITKKELFNELYIKYIDLKKNERINKIVKDMQKYFDDYEKCELFVNMNFDRKQRNLICRRVRMIRKANLVNFNYFCTFTYDDKKHTEQTFKKKLQTCFRNFCYRAKWKYMGVWERAPETKRLHFHGLFYIPDETMPGSVEEHRDYNFKLKRKTVTLQNSYFNERFGRSDFEPIKSKYDLFEEIAYIMKYLEKTEEKIVYSKGLYQYFISDIIEDDVVCTIGQEDRKLLLFDDFMCFNEGELIGKVSPEVIERMKKCN